MKTRLYTRKRALISSVAMLLVAMIALGTATFAWFTQSPNASAEGLSVQASASVGLKVLSESQAGKTGADVNSADAYVTKTFLNSNNDGTATLATNFILSPTSLYPNAGTVSAFKTTAASDDASDKDRFKAIEDAIAGGYNSNGDYYVEKVYATLVGTTAATTKDINLSVSIDQSGITKAMKSGMRVIVTYHDSTANTDTVVAKIAPNQGTYPVYTGTLAAQEAYADGATTEEKNAANTAYDALLAGVTTNVAYTATLGSTNVGKVSSNAGADYFTVYVSLDGNDANVKSRTVDASKLLSKITLNMSIPTE